MIFRARTLTKKRISSCLIHQWLQDLAEALDVIPEVNVTLSYLVAYSNTFSSSSNQLGFSRKIKVQTGEDMFTTEDITNLQPLVMVFKLHKRVHMALIINYLYIFPPSHISAKLWRVSGKVVNSCQYKLLFFLKKKKQAPSTNQQGP